MAAATSTSFGVPASHHFKADIAEVVSIARVHLDAVPESLLSIAASHSPEGEVVRLSSWHKPSVAVFKVIAMYTTYSQRRQHFANAAAQASRRNKIPRSVISVIQASA